MHLSFRGEVPIKAGNVGRYEFVLLADDDEVARIQIGVKLQDP